MRAVVELLFAWKSNDCGVFQLTAPQLAMTSFRHMCKLGAPKQHKLDIICDPNSPAHKLERQAYYGGRVTCYHVGTHNETIYHLDVNSLYPYVMHEHKFPRCYEFTRFDVPTAELQQCEGIYGLVAECLISTRTETFPLRVEGKQHHCTGSYWTVLCGPELHRALNAGCVHRTGRVQFYSIATYFREWVRFWFDRKVRALREVGNRDAVYRLAKIVLNSLSGKFAQCGRRWTERFGCVPLLRWGPYADMNPDTGERELCRGVANNKQVLTDAGEPRYSFPAISAYITAHGREYMQSLVDCAGEENVFYMATDSLMVNSNGYENLCTMGHTDPFALGKLRVVGTHNQLIVRGANYYSLDGVVTAAGLVGVMENAKREGKVPELFESVKSVISREPDGRIAVAPVYDAQFIPDYRGMINAFGRWRPYRITNDPEFTDRPPRSDWRFADSLDTERVRSLVTVDV